MKNIKNLFILAFFILSLFSISSANDFPVTSKNIKIGVDVNGKYNVSVLGNSKSVDINTGISLTGEYTKKTIDELEFGGGITFQVPRSLNDGSGTLFFIPIYGLIKIYPVKTEHNNSLAPYIITQLGFNFGGSTDSTLPSPTSFGGLGSYYGLGFGMNNKKNNNDAGFQAEILYSVNNADFSSPIRECDVKYATITLSLGFVF